MRKHQFSRLDDGLRPLPRGCAAEAITGLDLATEAGRAAARLRVATRLARRLTDAALLAACRARGLRHVSTGIAAAHALAALAVPDEGRSVTPLQTAACATGRPACPDPLVVSALAEVLAIVVARHAGVRRRVGGLEEGRPVGDAREAASDALDLLAARGVTIGRGGGAER